MTKEIEKKFEKHPLFSTEEQGKEAEVLVKYFNPYGRGTWLITEASKNGDDWTMYGYCHITDWEWGYVSFNELNETRVNVFGTPMPLERDLYAKGTVAELAD